MVDGNTEIEAVGKVKELGSSVVANGIVVVEPPVKEEFGVSGVVAETETRPLDVEVGVTELKVTDEIPRPNFALASLA